MSLTGSQITARSLKNLGVTVVFGIVGIPVVEVAEAIIAEGIRFVAFRNEQSASYAASAYGYLSGTPGVLLVVGGPGVVHALAGVFNSNTNRWPLVVLAGSCSSDEAYKGGFQELDQVTFMSPHTKFAGKPGSLRHLPRIIEKGYRSAFFGKPGATYIDLPADIIQGATSEKINFGYVERLLEAPRSMADPNRVEAAARLLAGAKHPLVVVGKGAAYANAAAEIQRLVNDFNLPFLPTPMGKGVVSDDSVLNFSSARSQVLAQSDVILLIGGRLNWILHHGEAPKFSPDVKFIQIDLHAEEIGTNAPHSVLYGLLGDIRLVAGQLHRELKSHEAKFSIKNEWVTAKQKNVEKLAAKESATTASDELLRYNRVYRIVKDEYAQLFAQGKVFLVTEGANTMDVARVAFGSTTPKSRLDAGTNATMGLAIGYAIAAKIHSPEKVVLSVVGDSAFGFSGLEIETAIRSGLPQIVVVMNNSGIYHGELDEVYTVRGDKQLPPTVLGQDTRYDIFSRALGGNGVLVKTEKDLVEGLRFALENYKKNETTILNVLIDRGVGGKIGFGWQKKGSGKL
ncbi:hypothetical protein BABINDRAFT_163351 [Babjeviella inositovora NRRL Y-12698]|uniref:2-hydroxyacyl-CoA lyase n=1 Tax=Babjeviella inositovora NRRL Y-12698 TaxID=984486 RepID=A0A1E3QJJ2_9ASCO|nr:uncharacterized protein BABINDRAFT_163351 [Babjeviella inositovora NRRL Y-12698]ODQ77634.1 hypothetical protein BABINDRAFT_163351 [Babjeviella inositovora NRRL Y-12698]